MRVTVDVYSGRPNPTWEISPSENEQVRAMLARLIGPTTATYPDWLGYRGVIIEGGVIQENAWDRARIGGGVIVEQGELGTRTIADPDRALERQLLLTGQGRIDQREFAAIRADAFPGSR